LSKARMSEIDFLPSPGKFISWCKPNPEDMGYPSTEKAKRLCIAHRAKENLTGISCMSTRPLIVELCSLVDWWLINAGTTPQQLKKAEAHFEKVYLELISSGYQEPKETNSPKLETSEVTKPRMSERQELDRLKRGRSHLDEIKNKLKKGRR